MGLKDKFNKAFGIGEYDEDIDDEELETEEANKPSFINNQKPYEERSMNLSPVQGIKPAEPPKPQMANTNRFTNTMKMIITEPKSFEDSSKLVDSLKARKPVVINLENLETDVARKIFDFLSGATYALNGSVQKVANNIFVFAPENVDLTYTQNSKVVETGYKSPWSK